MGILDLFRKMKEAVEPTTNTVQQDSNVSEYRDEYGNSFSEFLIEDVFTITGRGTVVTGRVVNGNFKVGDEIKIPQIGKTTYIIGIEMFRKSLEFVNAGDNAGILLKDISRDEIERGYTIVK